MTNKALAEVKAGRAVIENKRVIGGAKTIRILLILQTTP